MTACTLRRGSARRRNLWSTSMPNGTSSRTTTHRRLPSQLHDLEIAGGNGAERGIENVVVPARVVGAAHVKVGAVVGHDEAVGLHGLKDPAERLSESADVH